MLCSIAFPCSRVILLAFTQLGFSALLHARHHSWQQELWPSCCQCQCRLQQAFPSDASSDFAGGPEMWPSPKAHCIQASADPSHVTSPQQWCVSFPQHITSAPPGPAGWAKLHLDSLPIPISKPWVRVLTQLPAVNWSQWRGEAHHVVSLGWGASASYC